MYPVSTVPLQTVSGIQIKILRHVIKNSSQHPDKTTLLKIKQLPFKKCSNQQKQTQRQPDVRVIIRDLTVTTHVKGAGGRQFARTDGRVSALVSLVSSVLLVP